MSITETESTQSIESFIKNLPKSELKTWAVNTDALEEKTLETKYPWITIPIRNPYVVFLKQVLADPNTSVDEAIRMFENKTDEFLQCKLTIPTPIDFYETYLRENDIDIYNLAEQTVRAVIAEVHNLCLPPDVEAHVCKHVNDCIILFKANVEKGSHASVLSEVIIDIDQILSLSYQLAKSMRQPMSVNLIKSVFVTGIAHELGHIIDASFKEYKLSRDDYCSSTIPLDSEFPIIFPDKFPHLDIWTERFARYFEPPVLQTLGLSVEAREDDIRKYISEYMFIIREVPREKLFYFFLRLSDEVCYVNTNDDTDIRNHYEPSTLTPIQQMRDVIDFFLSGHPIGQAYPFSKEQVRTAIIQRFIEYNSIMR